MPKFAFDVKAQSNLVEDRIEAAEKVRKTSGFGVEDGPAMTKTFIKKQSIAKKASQALIKTLGKRSKPATPIKLIIGNNVEDATS